MASSSRPTPSRSRRRILGIGLALAFATFVIGSALYVNRIEGDLERRVPRELAEQGFAGVEADFSGQDGTLRCDEPLSDPRTATRVAYDVWGVRSITLDATCRVKQASGEDGSSSADDGTDVDRTTASSADSIGVDASASNAALPFATVADILSTDREFSLLSQLLSEAGVSGQLAERTAEPVTLFAPTDAAFDALPADIVAQLRTDPDLLAQLMQHHLINGAFLASQLRDGTLTMTDGHELPIVRSGATTMIGEATIIKADLVADNGIVHAIDRVFLPESLTAGASAPVVAPFEAAYGAGVVTLTGVVVSEVERATLVNAAGFTAGAANVVDQMTVDPGTGLDAATSASLAQLVGAMPGNLLSGSSGFDGSALFVRGIYADEAGRDAVAALATGLGVTADLSPPPAASDADAAALETALNEFVAANPIRFEPSSAILTADAEVLLDQIAAQALSLTGLAITIEGHTDSDGLPAANASLSQRRAEAVRDALIERGLDGAALTAEGFGSERPVVVDGVEDKQASRRVEFRIEATA